MATNKPTGVNKKNLLTKIDGTTSDNIHFVSEEVKKIMRLQETTSLDLSVLINKLYKQEQNKLNEINKLRESFGKTVAEINSDEQELFKLKKQQILDEHDWNKIELKERQELASEFLDKTEKIYDKNKDSITNSILGPMRMITKPLDDFTGGLLGDKAKGLLFGGKNGKANPNKSDVQKMGVMGTGFLFLANWLKPKKKSKDDKTKSLLDKLKDSPLGALITKNGGGGIGKKLWGLTSGKVSGRVMGGAAILGGGIMMAKDAVNATKQDWKSEDGKELNNPSKAIGGILGGVGSGMENAFANGGKWATMGYGIGNMILPGVGGIVGGALGGLLGGILGYIGGEKIAQGVSKLGTWIKDVLWVGMKDYFYTLFNIGKFKEIASSDDNGLVKVLKFVTTGLITWVTMPIRKIMALGSFVKTLTKDTKFGKAISGFMSSFMNTNVGKALGTGIEGVKGIGKIFDHMFDGVKWDKDMGIWDNIKSITNTIFNNITSGLNDFFKENELGKIISKSFGTILDVFSFIGEGFEGGIIEGFKNIGGFFDASKNTENKSSFDLWRESKHSDVDDAIIQTNGNIIRTNPNDTLIALKDINTSYRSVLAETNSSFGNKLSNISSNGNDIKTMISLLREIANKNLNIQLPATTRQDMDLIMCGGAM